MHWVSGQVVCANEIMQQGKDIFSFVQDFLAKEESKVNHCKCAQGHWGLHDDGCVDRPSLVMTRTRITLPVADELDVDAIRDAIADIDRKMKPWKPEVGQLVRFGANLWLVSGLQPGGRFPVDLLDAANEGAAEIYQLTDASSEWLTKEEIEPFIPLRAKVLGIRESDVRVEPLMEDEDGAWTKGSTFTWEIIQNNPHSLTEKYRFPKERA